MFFRKKKEIKREIIGIKQKSDLNKRFNVNELIVKLGGRKNIISVTSKGTRVKFVLKDNKKIVMTYFRTHKYIYGLFLGENNIAFIIGNDADKFANEIDDICLLSLRKKTLK